MSSDKTPTDEPTTDASPTSPGSLMDGAPSEAATQNRAPQATTHPTHVSNTNKGFVSFLQEFSIPLIAGVLSALVFANVSWETYHHLVEWDLGRRRKIKRLRFKSSRSACYPLLLAVTASP